MQLLPVLGLIQSTSGPNNSSNNNNSNCNNNNNEKH